VGSGLFPRVSEMPRLKPKGGGARKPEPSVANKGARHSLKGKLFPLYDPKPSELTISRVKGADWRLKARTVECDKILR
jgi:hypothetical protein